MIFSIHNYSKNCVGAIVYIFIKYQEMQKGPQAT